MSYEKQNFEDGQVLEAEHLNHMEDELARPKSWNELAGRPFGENSVVFCDGTYTSSDMEGMYFAMLENAPGFNATDNAVFAVEYDGVVYNNVARNGSFVGNQSAFGEEDTGEPFLFMLDANAGTSMVACLTDTEPTSHTIKLTYSEYVRFPVDKAVHYVTLYTTGVYLHHDMDCTQKVSKDELSEILKQGLPLRLMYQNNLGQYYFCVFAEIVNKYGRVNVVNDSALSSYYTAEYTPPTT